jgi:hypothetical protein
MMINQNLQCCTLGCLDIARGSHKRPTQPLPTVMHVMCVDDGTALLYDTGDHGATLVVVVYKTGLRCA